MTARHTIGSYLIQQIQAHGAGHVFGVPGDYILTFFGLLDQSPLTVVNTCDEQGAGFAADAYARLRGLGVVAVTYCVGGLKIANTTAQAYAEKSPVVVIGGAPGVRERNRNPLLHHKVRDFDTQLRIFEELTVASTVLDNPETACREIDRVLAAAVRYKRPVYIEMPRDMVTAPVPEHNPRPPATESSDPDALREALAEARGLIDRADRPVIIAGVELHRFGLQDLLFRLTEETQIPVASTLLSKSVISDLHPLSLGVYEGSIGREDVRDYVESSDCLILLGALMTDIDLGVFTARLDPARTIFAASERVAIHHHTYEDVRMRDFVAGLVESGIRRAAPKGMPRLCRPDPFVPQPGVPVTVNRLFQCVNAFIDDRTVVVADPGDSMFGAVDIFIHSEAEFLAPAYYTSLGFSTPGALGASLARPERRPLVLVGDGAFQMTGMEVCTLARFKANPVIVLFNNKGYSTERPMLDGPFNDILNWDYSRFPEILGAGRGFRARTEDELVSALRAARRHTESFSLVDVQLDPGDASDALRRITAALGRRVAA